MQSKTGDAWWQDPCDRWQTCAWGCNFALLDCLCGLPPTFVATVPANKRSIRSGRFGALVTSARQKQDIIHRHPKHTPNPRMTIGIRRRMKVPPIKMALPPRTQRLSEPHGSGLRGNNEEIACNVGCLVLKTFSRVSTHTHGWMQRSLRNRCVSRMDLLVWQKIACWTQCCWQWRATRGGFRATQLDHKHFDATCFDATCFWCNMFFLICQFFNFNRVGIVVVASNVLYGTWRLVESWFVQISASSCARTSTARDLWARFIAPPF